MSRLWCLLIFVLPGRAEAVEPIPVFRDGQGMVTFSLKDRNGEPPELCLFANTRQADTAASINYWRDTIDIKHPGVRVAFRGVRFLQRPGEDDALTVRLIGLKNEIEMSDAVSLLALQSGRQLELHFGPVTLGGAIVSGSAEVEMVIRYEPREGQLQIAKAVGTLEWRRPFADPQSDSGSLEALVGHVAPLPSGMIILRTN